MKKRLLLPFSLLCLAGMIVACGQQGSSSNQQSSGPDSSTIPSSEPVPSSTSSSESQGGNSSSSDSQLPPAPSSETPVNYTLEITNKANLAEEWFKSDGNRTVALLCSPGVVRQLIGQEIFVESSDPSIVKVENNQVLVPVAPGKVTITAIYHNAYASCKVEVKGLTRPATIESVVKGVVDKSIDNTKPATELFGTVTGIYGNTSIIQEGDYAMYVYNKNYDGVKVGDRAHLISTYTLYNGLVETSAVTIYEKSNKEAEEIKAKDIPAAEFKDLTKEDASRLINVSGIYSLGESLSKSGCAAQASSSAYRLSSVKIGDLETYIFVNKYLEQSDLDAINAKLNQAEADSMKIEVKGGHVYCNTNYMDKMAISITSADQLTLSESDIVTLPTAVALSLDKNEIGIADRVNVNATFTPSNTNRKGLSYESSDTSVATVNDSGVVTGVGIGKATITATSTVEGCSNVKGSVEVTVGAPEFAMSLVENGEYYLGLNQEKVGKKVFLTGVMDGTYGATVEGKENGLLYKAEKGSADGQFFLKGSNGEYLGIEKPAGKTFYTLKFTAEPIVEWSLDAASYGLKATYDNQVRFMGTSMSNTYTTIGIIRENQVPSNFIIRAYDKNSSVVPSYQFDGEGTEAKPYSVRDALHIIDELADSATTADSFVIRGFLKAVTTAYSAQYGNITFTIGDTADATDLLTCFRVKTDADTAALLVPGTFVEVTGKLQRYISGTNMTPELASGGSVKIGVAPYQFDGEGTEAKPYSVKDALHLIDEMQDGATTTESFFIKGILKEVTTAYSAQYGNITFTIGDTADATNLLTCFRVKCDADTAALLVAGADVTVNGKLQRYVKNEVMTPELATGGSVKINPVAYQFDGEGTEAKPYSVKDALHLIDEMEDGATTTESFFIKGILKEVTTAYSAQYGNITFTIGDTADATNLLTCFRVKCDADTAALLVAGANVTVSGKLQRYVKNEVMTPELATGGSVTIAPAGYQFDGQGTEAKPYSVKDALHVIDEMEDGKTTTESFFIKGILKEVTTAYSAQYGNITFTIGDTADATNLLTCFRVACDADTAALLVAGADVTVSGKLQRYVKNDVMTPELATGGSVKINGGATPVDPTPGEGTKVSVTVETLMAERQFKDAVSVKSFGLDKAEDAIITVTATGGGNTGKFYANGNNWRIYQNENPTVTISAKEGYTIVSVKITYTVNNNGILVHNNTNVASPAAIDVNGSSVTFTVANTGTATNGQVRITAFEVVYK